MKPRLLATRISVRLRLLFNYRIQILRLGDISDLLLPRLTEARLHRDQRQSHLYVNGTNTTSNHPTLARTLAARRPLFWIPAKA